MLQCFLHTQYPSSLDLLRNGEKEEEELQGLHLRTYQYQYNMGKLQYNEHLYIVKEIDHH